VILEQLPLSKQVEIVFHTIREELMHMTSGIVFLHVRNNVVGKFGVRHFPLENKGGVVKTSENGLTETMQATFRQLATELLKHKKSWTHGEIAFEFALRNQTLCASVIFESHYNMANVMMSPSQRRHLKELL